MIARVHLRSPALARILRLYVIREIALPTVLSLLTITFILLIGIVYEFINLLLQPGVSFWSVLHMLSLLLPSYITFALPMAVLMGVLIGVGRLTLDREILAIKASGINLLNIFIPSLALALALSLGILWISGNLIPRWQGKGLSLMAQLQFELIQSLEPERFHDKLNVGQDNDMVLYFRERDEKLQDHPMKGVVLKIEEDFEQKSPKATPGRAGLAKASNSLNAPAGAGVAYANSQNQGRGSGGPSISKNISGGVPAGRSNLLTMIFAESGQIHAQVSDLEAGGRQAAEVILTLLNGTIHRLSPDPAKPDNVVIHFQKLEKKLFTTANIKKPFKTQTNAELRESIRAANQNLPAPSTDKDDKKKGSKSKLAPKRELVERHALALAFFVFALMAIPLAIWIKPSGKSWGILLAIAMMLIYYVFMKIGGSMVEIGHPLGVVVAFSPNLLFTLLGAGLWRHTLRS
jgi:lipopolysaccharide export LptBFGC system permease protein LptF